jgi:hypothetical protein
MPPLPLPSQLADNILNTPPPIEEAGAKTGSCSYQQIAIAIVVLWGRGFIPSREFWMLYRGPGFPTVVWFDSSPIPSHQWAQEEWERETTCGLERGGGAKSYDRKKVWRGDFSSLFSVQIVLFLLSSEALRLPGKITRF